jgi:hypothetical protein
MPIWVRLDGYLMRQAPPFDQHDLIQSFRAERECCLVGRKLGDSSTTVSQSWAEESQMSKGRLEAFSDGVFAVIITIMVLNLNVPRGSDLQALKAVLPVFLCYVLSYIYVGIYWNNHYHLLHASEHVSGGILWANLVLLFYLSLAPFTTAWMGENHYAPLPVAIYGVSCSSPGSHISSSPGP